MRNDTFVAVVDFLDYIVEDVGSIQPEDRTKFESVLLVKAIALRKKVRGPLS